MTITTHSAVYLLSFMKTIVQLLERVRGGIPTHVSYMCAPSCFSQFVEIHFSDPNIVPAPFLVGVETNPGPDFDGIHKSLENLSLQNRRRLRKPRYAKEATRISREISIAKKCLKTAVRQAKETHDEFSAQMFELPTVPLKMDEGQYAEIVYIGRKITDFVESVMGRGKNEQVLEEKMEKLGASFAFGSVEGISQAVVKFFGMAIESMCERYGDHALTILVIILVAYSYKKCEKRSHFLVVCTGIAAVLALLKRSKIAEGFSIIREYFRTDEEEFSDAVEAQMLDSANIADIVTLLLTVNLFPKMYKNKGDLLKLAAEVGRNYSGIEGTVTFVMRILQKLLDHLSILLGFKNFTLLSTLVPKLDDWVADVRETLTTIGQRKVVRDMKLYEKIVSLEDRSYELLSLYASDRKHANIGILVRPLSNELTKMRLLLEQEGVGLHKMGQPPIIISFAGGSNIGKSRSMRPFVARLLAMVLPQEELERAKQDLDSMVYSRQPEHEYWDGYTGQIVCFLDEKDLVKESLMTASNASADLIRMGNIFPNVLHMAGIEQKGNVYFRSKIVVCSTNILRSYDAAKNAVRYPEAVVNRIDFELIVQPKEAFVKPEDRLLPKALWRLDKSKLPKDYSFSEEVHDYVVLERVRDPSRPHDVELIEGDTIDFEELLVRCAHKYKEQEKLAEAIVKDDKTAFDEGLRLRNQHFAAQMDEHTSSLAFDNFLFYLSCGGVSLSFLGEKFAEIAVGSEACDEQELGKFYDKIVESSITSFEMSKEEFIALTKGKLNRAKREELLEEIIEEPHTFITVLRLSQIVVEKKRKEENIFNSSLKKILRMLESTTLGSNLKNIVSEHFNNVRTMTGVELTLLVGALSFGSLIGFIVGEFITKRFFEGFEYLFGGSKEPEKVKQIAHMSDPALEDISMKIWLNNYYGIHFLGDEKPVGYGFFSHDNTFNLCSHYLNTWATRNYHEEKMELKGITGHNIPVKVRDLLTFEQVGEDWSRGEIANTRRHGDIRPLMTDASVLIRRPQGTIMMMRVNRGTVERVYANYSINFSCVYKDPVGKEYKLPVSMKYDIPTKVGECGLPLFIVDPTTRSKKFVGFHVAGTKVFGTCYVFKGAEDSEQFSQARYVPRTMVEAGTVERPVGTSGTSNIVRSPLYGAWGPALKAPARLTSFIKEDGGIVFPMERALMRYDQPILSYDTRLVNACARAAVAANVSNSAFREQPRLVTMAEAIIGIPGMPFMEGLNRSTSPGYPWNMKPRPGFKGKERFFGQDAELKLEGPDWEQLKNEVDEAHVKLRNGVRPDFYFCDSLKDELVKKEKARNGDTRLFCPSPIAYQILFGMYFKDFARKMMDSRIQGEHAVGVNVYSEEWDVLKRTLTTHGEEFVVAGDFKSFDALQSSQVLRAIGEEIISSFADREHDQVRRLLWEEVWESKHIVYKTIFHWKQSLPSGHPLTTIANCLFVGTTMRMCWVKANNDDISSLRRFTDLVKLIAYGDDNVLNVAEPARGIFNQHTITTLMNELGLIYTPEDKSSDPPAFRNIKEIEFLKRKFRYEPYLGRTVAPLRLETILEMPYWTKREGYEEIWRGNLENAIRELSLHDESVFEEWCPRLVEASRQKTGYVPLLIDKRALLDEIVKKEDLYKTQMRDVAPSYLKTLNIGKRDRRELVRGRQKFRKQSISLNTAFDQKPRSIYSYPTKMGCVKQYLGHFRSGMDDGVITIFRFRPAQNTDNNNMVTELSVKNDMTGTTQILNESGVKTVERASLLDVPQGLLSATRVGYTQSSIYDFLAKPVLLNTFAWNSQAAGDVLLNKSLPADAFSVALYANKLEGFLGFRGTTVVRLQVNGNKFQAGRLVLVFIPQGNVASSWPGMRLRSLKAATQLPRVEIDLSSETEIVMEIPYISPTPFYNFNDSTGPIGRVAVMVYSPLVTGTGSTEANISLWCHFKDVELVAPAVAQMADRRPRKNVKKANPSEQELAIMGDHPISGGLTHMASAASSFAKIPLLSSLAGPAAWALNCMAGAASAFGYSKPGTEAATTKVMTLHNFNSQNHNGVDMYPNMGLDASNKLSVMPGYAGTDVDEMSLNHLVQIPAYFDVITMATTSVAGSTLATYDVHPHLGNTSSIVNLWATRDMTPLSYFSSFFDLWRGSLVFTIKVVKTSFHSGRIMISYNPCNISPSVLQTNYLLREIIDIRDTTEFRFVVPYTATTQYKKTHGFTNTMTDSIGILKFHVLNELVAPDTVANSIKLLVEVSAGPDFELACPLPYSAAPIIVSSWSSQMADVIPSSQKSSRDDKNQELVAIGSSIIEKQSLEPALYCIGEKCNSILQLLKRYCIVNGFGLNGTSRACIDFRPFLYGACYSSDAVATPTVFTGDYMSMFGPCFAYARGSVRAMLAPNPYLYTAKGSSPSWIYSSTLDTPFRDSDTVQNFPGLSINFQPDSTTSPVGIAIPAYQQLHCRLNRPSTGSTPEPVDIYTSSIRAGITSVWGGAAQAGRLYRAAGDDFALGYFIGVPLVTTSVAF